MSLPRLIVRVLLVLLLVCICWIAGSAWLNTKGGGNLAAAQQAMDSGDLPAAKIHLMNLLSADPENGQAHALMGEYLLAAAKQTPGEPTTYVTNSKAREELKAAARLREDDVELQKKLLEVLLDRGSLAGAAEVADTIAKIEPNYPDAVLSQAIAFSRQGNKTKAAEKLNSYFENPTSHVYRAHALAIDMNKGETNAEAREAAFSRSIADAEKLTGADITEMALEEQLLLSNLLQAAVAESSTPEQAHRRASAALQVSQIITDQTEQKSPKLAELIATVMTLVQKKYPQATLSADQVQQRRAIEGQAESLLSGYTEAGIDSPLVYRQAALAAIDKRAYEQAEEILEKGLKACENLPSSRSNEVEALHLLAARNMVLMRRYNAAAPHLQVLRESSESSFSGWGELLSGGVASAEGRHGTALRHYQRAQGKLGKTPFVEIALANTFLRLGAWTEALPRLQSLKKVLDSADPEQQAWAQLHGVYSQRVEWDEFRAYLAVDDWDKAKELLISFAGTQRGPEAETLAAAYLVRKDRADEAIERIASARKANPDSVGLASVEISLAYRQGEKDRAEQLIDALAADDALPSQLALAHWRLRQQRPEDALAVVEAAQQRWPESPAPQMLKARVYLAMDKPREALAIGQALQASPKTAGAGKAIELMQALRQQDFDEASSQLAAISSESPTVTPQMSLLSGSVAAAKGDLASAIEQVGNSLDVTNLKQQSHSTLLKAVLLLAAKEGPEAAEAALAPLLEKYPHNPFLHVTHADLLLKQRRNLEGLAALDRAEKELPASPTAPYLKAATWADLGDSDQALAEANRALSINERYTPARLLAARLQLAAGKPARALKHADKLLADNPRQWPVYFVKAEALQQMGRRGDAVGVLAGALKTEPRLLPAYRGLMSLLLADNRAAEALKVCQQARKAFPNQKTFTLDEIAIHCQTGNLDTAKQLAESLMPAANGDNEAPAADGQASSTGVALTVSQTFSNAGQFDLGLEWAERAIELAGPNEKPAAHLLMGEMLLLRGEAQDDQQMLAMARDQFALVLQSHPQNFVAGNNLAWLLATEFDQPAKAAEVADKVRNNGSAAELPLGFIDTLAVVYRAAGQDDKARDLLEQASEIYPEQPMLMFHLGLVYAGSDQQAAATNLLERALSMGSLSEEQTAEARRALDAMQAARQP